MMLETIPTEMEMSKLLGQSFYSLWLKLCVMIDEKYEMEQLWNQGGKNWVFEYKFRRGGKTLCALYAKENCLGFMIILGKDERVKFENNRTNFSYEIQKVYDETATYHDGKWIMIFPNDTSLFDDLLKLCEIKRKPNIKDK